MLIIDRLNKILLRRLFICESPQVNLTEFQYDSIGKFQTKVNKGVYTFESISCLCGDSEGICLTERDRYCLSVSTYLCKSCGIMRTSPRLDESSLSKFYDQDYRSIYVGHSQAPDDFFEEQESHGRLIMDFLKPNFKFHENLTVFDVGCGAGGVLIPFKNLGCKVFGCDLGSQYLNRGKSIGLILEHGDIKSLDKYGKADLVILCHVLEHFPNPLEELEKIYNSITDRGYLYIELPGIFKIHRNYVNPLRFFQNAHLYHFSLSTLNFILGKAGFELVKGDENIRALYRKTDKRHLSNFFFHYY
ncbi:MAG: class I SAM-dependent methyltransferase, partial [Moorea sp. SIO4E2]|uniref:class I SAM-dependent methyltransferase n=1 Tax=Moorena sp. SIO4E2 TaxID=2607826 RepID=UPI0013B6BAD8